MPLSRFQIYWTNSAEKDLQEIIEYIALDKPNTAQILCNKIRITTEKLSIYPTKGRLIPELKYHNIYLYREIIENPWRIIYKINTKYIYIMAIIDSKRNVEDILLNRLLR